jgi:hypothetical protein
MEIENRNEPHHFAGAEDMHRRDAMMWLRFDSHSLGSQVDVQHGKLYKNLRNLK